MQQTVLEAKKRTETGKTPIREARRNALIPGIIYGKKSTPLSIYIGLPALEKALQQGAAHKIINIKIDSDGSTEDRLCVIQEIQRDSLGKKLNHVDFHHISMEDKLTAKIPITIKGDAPGVKEGGVLDHVLWEVEVRALPLNLPEKITVDVSSLAINQSIHVRDIVPPEGVEILEEPSEVVAVVHPPRVEEAPVVAAPAEGAAATPAQPEVIAKGKKEEAAEGEEKEKPKKA